ncbi:hypothetical protein ACFQ4E_06415 [Litorisediminicola beolgyonensis]|uniref:Uncharacterized protein n=1 Tax=Litorisediminicola beolgyonensis TaxID=1173614 RepID=A0ABW3ZGA6_9RHOB
MLADCFDPLVQRGGDIFRRHLDGRAGLDALERLRDGGGQSVDSRERAQGGVETCFDTRQAGLARQLVAVEARDDLVPERHGGGQEVVYGLLIGRADLRLGIGITVAAGQKRSEALGAVMLRDGRRRAGPAQNAAEYTKYISHCRTAIEKPRATSF